VVKLLDTLPSSLKSLSDIISICFVGNSHPHVKLVKSCKLLYVHKFDITIWLTWLKMNHIGYKNTTMNMYVLNTLPENDILELIMRSMFQLKNVA
jgi:N6-adenosine-specific RNA methylase IME4